VTRAEFEKNLHEKMAAPVFLGDVGPLVAPGVEWNMEDVARHVLEKMVSRIPGEPWRGRD